ncbi:hypothetical protein [Kitasatospora sp. KL5]|uniref:hypothetical protein n=1 Tax=Kitasatospora sp. KL5 TaxID=3425125 RepID=UPI003D6FF12A
MTTAPAAPVPARTSAGRPAGAKQLTVWIDGDLHKRMSRYKVESGQDLKTQVEEAMAAFLAQRGF